MMFQDKMMLRELLHVAADILTDKLHAPGVTKVTQHKLTTAMLKLNGETELVSPADDGNGEWALASWKTVDDAVVAHWTRVVSVAAPEVADDGKEGAERSDTEKPPWGPASANGEATVEPIRPGQ